MSLIRINKYLAGAGVCSRRSAEELIKQGRVCINGTAVILLSSKVDEENDVVEVDGKLLKIQRKKIYLMLNKPVGVVSTSKDKFDRPTVMDFVKEVDARLHNLGRLDYESSGLIILTNDGDFSNKVMHPKNKIEKEYIVHVKGVPSKEDVKAIETGIDIDGYITSPAKISIIKELPNSSEVMITIWEGKNRQIWDMFETIGNPVISLKRTAFGNIRIGKLKEGGYRHLKQNEIDCLSEL